MLPGSSLSPCFSKFKSRGAMEAALAKLESHITAVTKIKLPPPITD